MTFTIFHSTPSKPRMEFIIDNYSHVAEQGAMWSLEKLTGIDIPWGLDNGAYTEYTKGEEWDREGWFKRLNRGRRLVNQGDMPPARVVVVPDIVGDAEGTYERSEEHRGYIPDEWGAYFSVQDGMDVERACDFAEDMECQGIFVGGSVKWKQRVMRDFIEEAHGRELKCHVARPSGSHGLRMAMMAGADSVDTSTIISNGNWHYFKRLENRGSLL